MPTHPLSWIRRRSSVDDLLDDGVENYSDLKVQTEGSESWAPADPKYAQIRSATLARIKSEQAALRRSQQHSLISYFGLLISVLFLLGGALIFLYPVDMLVHHVRAPRLNDFIEHVGPLRSKIYGVSIFLIGIAVGYYAIYRPRGHRSG